MSRLLVAQRALTVPGWAKDALWRRAQAIPSLDLRFADNKSLVDAVTSASLVTFTRASSGTYTDSAGVIQTAATDVPRFDHNPTTGESLGLLVEEQRTNLPLRSEEFDNASWAKDFTTATADADTAPNGTTTADKVAEDSSNNFHAISQYVSGFASGAIATLSIYAKAAGRTRFRIQTDASAGFGTADFNLSTGTATAGTGVVSNGSIINVGDGWYRCSARCTTSGAGAIGLKVILAQSTYGTAYTGDGTSGIYFWGAQLEAGAFPTSYIPTTTAAVTRSASLADLISGAIANNIRSFYVEFRSPAVGTRGVVSLNDNTANERASVLTSGTDPRLVVHDGGVEQADINGGTVAAGVRTRVAVRINADDFAISINGGAVVTDTSGTLPTVDRLMIGRTQAGEYLNGRIARFTGWSQLLPNATLQTLAQ